MYFVVCKTVRLMIIFKQIFPAFFLTGSMLGMSMAIHSLIRSISPAVGGFLFQSYGFSAFGALGFVMNGLLYLYLITAGTTNTSKT